MNIQTAVWGVKPRDPKDPDLFQGRWLPSLEAMCGQVLACTIVKAAAKPQKKKERLWLNRHWREFREDLQVNSYFFVE
jgi:hypothetical protein